MTDNVAAVLTPWSNFYIMIGSSAAALTGLMFVVITLLNREDRGPTDDGIAAYSTPTVLHFSMSLLTAAVIVAPWRSLVPVSVVLGVAGAYGIVHIARVMRRARGSSAYDPDLEDWIAYSVLPLVAYAIVLGAAIAFVSHPVEALFGYATGVVVLLFVGIRNAWDLVTFLVTRGASMLPPRNDGKPPPGA